MEKEKKLHVVAFNVPFPPNYGGIIDIYYKLKALKEQGVKIILHAFLYERKSAPELQKVCHEVYYYRRKTGPRFMSGRLPYIVSTRQSADLSEKLLSDNHPVLFEGLHSTYYLDSCVSKKKKVFVRTHNIEHNYYKMLARSERNLFRKLYLFSESGKLSNYEKILAKADNVFAISTTDHMHFREHYGNSIHISAFHQHEEVSSQTGNGDYVLFHGNLSVPENEKALLYLLRNVLSKVSYRVIIAGKDPGNYIKRTCGKFPNIDLVSNPDGALMDELIRDAHINLLYTYQPTGLKLKLLHSLYAGRHCMANPLMLSGSGLEELCHIYRRPSEAIKMLDKLMTEPFETSTVKLRREALKEYGNSFNANKITALF